MKLNDRDRGGATTAAAPFDLGRRVAVGSLMVAGRSVVVQVIALAGTIVIARHLSPLDLGVLAIGFTIAGFASVLADGGLAAGLIREARKPSRRDLQVALGLQLTAMAGLAALAAAAVSPFPGVRTVTFLILVALPVTAFQTPAKVVLERDLDYRRVAVIEVSEYAAYYAWAAGAVLLGYGVWGVASASIVRALVASTLALSLVPAARTFPVWSRGESRALLGFGVRYQAVNVTNLLRDQAINIVTVGLAGTSALGIWTLASRMLQAPILLFSTLWRVSYPAMSRVVVGDTQPRDLLERAAGATAVMAGALLAPLAATAPSLVPALFGAAWSQAAWIVTLACAALMIGGPVSVAAAGYLYALGDTQSVLRSAVFHSIAWVGGVAIFLPLLGPPGIGVALVGGSAVDAIVLGRATRRKCGARLLPPIVAPALVAFVATLFGLSAALMLADSLLGAISAACLCLGVYVVGLAFVEKVAPTALSLRDLASLLRRMRGSEGSRRPPLPGATIEGVS
jgi:O-antigen/teichoic acid export membrane protein